MAFVTAVIVYNLQSRQIEKLANPSMTSVSDWEYMNICTMIDFYLTNVLNTSTSPSELSIIMLIA